MNLDRSLALLSCLALSAALSLGGCKSNNQQANSQNAQSAQSPQSTSAAPPPGSDGANLAPAGATQGASTPAGSTAPQGPPPPAVLDLPSGTRIGVRLDQDLGSKISQPGDSFAATVAADVLVNGQVVIPRGARAEGTVIDARPLGRFKGGAVLSVRLSAFIPGGEATPSPPAPSIARKKARGSARRDSSAVAQVSGRSLAESRAVARER